ncbi:hypothetical protein [Streptomyces sp. NPDC058694]|uniref:hypothetical protein n=1 Tax=Streptomyces sp. NPDC058694 TaxID=3346603 RepID=UPI0036679057
MAWNAITTAPAAELTLGTSWAVTAGVVPLDGRPHAVTGSIDGLVRVWDLTTCAQTRELVGHSGPARAVAVVELNGRPHAVTGGDDGTVRVWDLTTGTCLTTFHCPAPVSALAVTTTSAVASVVVGFGHEVAVFALSTLKGSPL